MDRSGDGGTALDKASGENLCSSYVLKRSRLQGAVRVSGAKNSLLKLLTASILTDDRVQLSNFASGLLDAQVHVDMLRLLGKQCEVAEDEIRITEPGPLSSVLDWRGRSIRNTLLILGALTARTGNAAVPMPGGCALGGRGTDLHEMILREMGAKVWLEDCTLYAESPGRLKGAEIHLRLRSTGATENAIICGSLAEGVTRVWNPHIRPEILDLIAFLRSMGAKIRLFGQEHIEVEGVESLTGSNYRVIPDNMEAITWLVASVLTDGDVEILDFPFEHLEVPLVFLRESGARFYRSDASMIVRGGTCYPIEISTGPYPGINSDMQPLFAIYGACAKGESRIVDLRFPDRYGYAEEMAKLGVQSTVTGNMLRITGGSPLTGTSVRALDLRAGVALALGGLCAGGETTVTDAWQIERGYEGFVTKLKALGGDIECR